MIRKKSTVRTLLGFVAIFVLSFSVFADTIRLKDGSIIKGTIVSFADGRFTVSIGEGARRRELTLAADEIASIEFEPRGKIAHHFGDEGSVALEYYSSLGPFSAFEPRSEQNHQLFASFEKELHERWEFALSYGHGLTVASDRSVIATRVEYNFSR